MSFKSKMEDIAEIIMGQSPQSQFVNEVGEGVPLLNGPTEFSEYNPIPIQFTTNGKKFSEKGDILFCVRGSTTGKMNYSDTKYAIGRGLAAIRGKNGYETPYIRAILENKLEKLLIAATGSTFPNVGKELLNKFEVTINSIDEAKHISQIYEKITNKIQLNNAINQTLEAITQALFKSWFIDFDPVKAKIAALDALSPGVRGKNLANQAAMTAISGKNADELNQLQQNHPEQYAELLATAKLFPSEMQDSELGQIPLGWKVKPLKSISTKISKGTTPRKADLAKATYKNKIPFIKVRDISDFGEILIDSLDYIPNSISKTLLSRSILQEGDILVSIAGTIGRVAVVSPFLEKSNCNQAVAFVRLSQKNLTQNIVKLALISDKIQFEMLSKIVQGVQANLSLNELGNIQILMPTLDLLNAFNTFINPHSSQQKELTKENQNLVNLRDTLLPKLLSGEIDVSGIEEEKI